MGLLRKYNLREWYHSMGCLFLPAPSLLHRTSEYAVTECILKNNGFNVFTSAEELEK